jgi:hypothetical protein
MSAIAQFLPHPVLRRLLRRYPVDPRYRRRAAARLRFSAMLEPLRWYERLRYAAELRATEVEAPLFLLGYGRSGTTHLHYLLWQDPRFAAVTNYQANAQPVALLGRGWLQRRFAAMVPRRRPMDNVALSVDAPQEEEIALVNSSEHAALHFMSFPRQLPAIYDRYVSRLAAAEPRVLNGWKAAYLQVLRKATLLGGGRRLVLKTPTNTGRIGVLHEMFPAARFVHIVRDPYRVYQSMRNMYRVILPSQTLQELDWQAIDAWTVSAYEIVMKRYLAERAALGDQLFEIRYEDLDARPLEVLGELYAALDLGDFAALRPRMQRYLDGLGSFAKNRFEYPGEVIDVVNENWGFALDAFGYERLRPGQVPREGEGRRE